MLIKRLIAKNWTCHRKLDLEFKPGLNGCLGANGTGKSSILDALRFCITGESIADGKYDENIMLGEKTAQVTVEFEHGDTTYHITRKLCPNKSELTFSGQSFTKVAEIEAQITSILDAKIDALLNNVFVGQHAIDSILFKTNTERLKEFQDTFGLTRLSEAYRMLSSEVATSLVTPGLREQRDLTVEAAKASAKEAQEHRASLMKLEAAITKLMPIVDSISKHDQLVKIKALRMQSEAVLARLEQETKDVQASVDVCEKSLLEVKQSIADVAEGAASATLTLAKHQQEVARRSVFMSELQKAQAVPVPPPNMSNTAETLAKLTASITKLKAILAGTDARPKLPDELSLEAELLSLEAELTHLRAPDHKLEILQSDVKRETQTLETFASGSCPTCLRPMDNFDPSALEKKIEALKAAIHETVSERKRLVSLMTDKQKAIVARLAEHQAAAKGTLQDILFKQMEEQRIVQRDVATSVAMEAAYAAAQKRIIELQTSLGSLQLLSDEEIRISEQIVAAHNVHVERYKTLKGELSISSGKLVSLTSEGKRVRESMPQFDGTGFMSDAEYQRAKEAHAELATLVHQQRDVETKVGIAEAKLQTQQNSVEDMNQRLDAESKTVKWASLCTRARDVVHVTGLPTLMMKEYAARINSRIAYYMRVWESPFRFFLNDELSFRAIFDDGTEMAAARLSGGQKIVASTSFRLAMSDTFARGVGLLILDEPTNHLDSDNITHLQQLLVRLKQLAGTSQRQIIIVTHAEQLTGFFDNTIRLMPHKITA